MTSIPKALEKEIAARILEASGLLALIKPLANRGGKLTKAEQRVMTDTAWQAARLLSDAQSAFWKAEDEAEKTSKMVRPNGDLFQ
ncbi:hypothetical protein [Sphingomonas sp.]|uniref:hypothetical protein n=1 Tax=Sphingomonas sp. TaxID=28214 RepID=UPI0025D81A72|nr:hypothetical protein [Sphingomonas sp.]